METKIPDGNLTDRVMALRMDGARVDVAYAPFGWRIDASYERPVREYIDVFSAEDGDIAQIVVHGTPPLRAS